MEGRIEESAELPESGHFYGDEQGDGSWVHLPDYGPEGASASRRLTLTDCHSALCAVIKNARLIIFELAYRRRRFSLIRGSSITLSGNARRLDEILCQGVERGLTKLDLSSIVQPYQRFNEIRTEHVLERLVRADHRFRRSNDDLKRRLLRRETKFRKTVFEPLKSSLIKKREPDFAELIRQAQTCASDFEADAKTRRDEVKSVVRSIQESSTWADVIRLASKADRRIRTAVSKGWKPWMDDDFERLQSRMFNVANGPQSVIDFLDAKIQSLDRRHRR